MAETERFICEIPLKVTNRQARELSSSFEVGRQAYNACLREALRRLDLMRESRGYRAARKLPKGPVRTAAFRAAHKQFGFREFDLITWSGRLNHTWLGPHLRSDVLHTLAQRAFSATGQYAFGKRGRPRFKNHIEQPALEGFRNTAGPRYRNGQVVWRKQRYDLCMDVNDQRVAHALASTIKRVRLVRRPQGQRIHYAAQLVCDGIPYRDPNRILGQGRIGIDPGPRTFGIVTPVAAVQVDLTTPLSVSASKIRRLERVQERRRRSTNPDNYTPDGQVKPKGACKAWRRSAAYGRTQARLADLRRKAAARRKNNHGRLAHVLLAQGNDIRVERNSHKSMQRSYGRSIGSAAPAAFITRLAQSAKAAGATFTEINPTSTTAFSQFCVCGAKAKKPLSQRVHKCPCGVTAQRDIFSAWLLSQAIFDPQGSSWGLDTDQLKVSWSGARLRLPTASSPISVEAFCASVEQAANEGRTSLSLRSSGPGIEWFVGAAYRARGEVKELPKVALPDVVALPVKGVARAGKSRVRSTTEQVTSKRYLPEVYKVGSGSQ